MSTGIDYPKTAEIKIKINREILRKDPVIAKIVEDFLNSREKAGFRKDSVKSLLVPEFRKLVVDANGQRTMDGDNRKYIREYRFDVSDQKYIQANFAKAWEWTKEVFGVTIKQVIMVPVKKKQLEFWIPANQIKSENIQAFDSEKSNELLNVFFSIKYEIDKKKDSKEYYLPVGVGPFCFYLSDFAWYAGRGAAGDNLYWMDLKRHVYRAFEKCNTTGR